MSQSYGLEEVVVRNQIRKSEEEDTKDRMKDWEGQKMQENALQPLMLRRGLGKTKNTREK